MEILKLDKRHKKYIAGAYIYSEHPDPIWDISEKTVMTLVEIWNALEGWEGEHPVVPLLAYRGCFLRYVPDLKWFSYGGVVTLRKVGGSESRVDKGKHFERLLLNSAPDGTLPKGLP